MFRRRLRTTRSPRDASRARLLPLLAGLAAGARQTRRGSFLIMVVGTLALLAVITIVYVSIGRADRQASAAAVRVDERDEVPDLMRDYIRGIIADDLFDTLYLGERDANDNPLFRRETWDYPSTAYSVIMPNFMAGGPDIINPLTISGGSGGSDAQKAPFWFHPTGNYTGTDPWLASAEPALLNYDGTGLSNETAPDQYPLERLDWMNLSNIAPDGAFVNLFNLRDNFDATPWEMRGYRLDADSAQAKLSLHERNPEIDTSRRGDRYFGGAPTDSDDADALPADWTSGQKWGLFPKADPKFGPDEPEYLFYQYADADGDGLWDSRWFEFLIDRSPTDREGPVSLLPPDPRLRFFFAVRIVDLSGRVNVNTATDATLAPVAEDPYGLNPAAVDLRRLLTLEDFYTDQRFGFGYESTWQPKYSGGLRTSEDYSTYSTGRYDGSIAFPVGEKAYDSIRMVLDTGIMPERGYQGLFNLDTGTGIEREFSTTAGGATANPYWDSYWKLGGQPLAPSDYYELYAGYGPGGGAGLNAGADTDSGLARSFGNDSLLELLVRNGINDDTVRSPFEVATGARADYSGNADFAKFSPLRDNRSTDLERGLDEPRTPRDPVFLDQGKLAVYVDPRRRLTTINGGRPFAPSIISAVRDSKARTFLPDSADLPLDDADLKRPIEKLFTGTQSLFETYADALLPYSANQAHWDTADADYDKTRTLYYGHRGPHLALRTAAQLTLNMKDAYDTGDTSTVRTLILNGSQDFRNNRLESGGQRNPFYPWQLLDLDETNTSGDPRLWTNASAPPPGMPDAVNVFGIEAQPFITEAASFVMYTDTPKDAGGDDDSKEQQLNGIRVWRFTPSIDGRVPDTSHPDNPDFLFEVLAFQIHNPFDESITLSGDSSGDITKAGRGLYYLQYGDLFLKFTDISTGAEQEIVLSSGQTKTFYVLSQHPDTIARRIHRITSDLAYGSKTLDEEKARIVNWTKRQLGEDAILIPSFDPSTGLAHIPPNNILDLRVLTDLQQGSAASRRTLKLWRVEKPEEDPSGGLDVFGLDESLLNDTANDTLVDRMRDPDALASTPSLDRRLWEAGVDGVDKQKGQGGKIEGAEKGPEPPDSEAGDKDNRGLSLTRYSFIRRNGDTRAGASSTVPRAGLPAYCLELKDQSGAAANDNDDDRSAQKSLDIDDFRGRVGDDTLDDLLGKQSGGADLANRLVPTISIDPDKKSDDSRLGIDIKEIPNNLASPSVPFTDLYVEPHLNNDEFEVGTPPVSTMRLADLLLPMGIGPHQIPDPLYNGGDENIEWTTLSEALAMALYYEDPLVNESVYSGAFVPPVTTGDPDILLDRAGLQYDTFVPFYDADMNGLFDPNNDARWGLGVPLAATLFDSSSTLPPKFGSLRTPTYGQMNINTVSRETARALPGLSPSANTGPDGSPNWWWDDTVTHDWRSDIATTLVAYRDRLAVFARDVDGAEPIDTLNFRNWWDDPFDPFGGNPLPKANYPPGEHDAELNGDNGRWGATGVMGLRENLGFRAVGELALVRDLSYTGADPNYLYPHDIDRLGFDGNPVDQPGIDSVSYGTGTPPADDGIDDDYDERLALANAVMASSSVRSDVFAVWFIVHGYQESDVKNLRDTDPLVPSVARRFVMVVDRSNVTEPGQKPRIVLFKEVPL